MKSKHLTLDQRKAIQDGIENRLSKTAIARLIGKDPSTVAKEITAHRKLKPRNRFNSPIICANFKSCTKPRKLCSDKCPQYKEQSCSLRDRSIGACNHCERIQRCRLDHFFYNASRAHEEYLFHLSDSRQGVNLSEPHRILIAQTIKPLLIKASLFIISLKIIPNLIFPSNPFIHTLRAAFSRISASITSLSEGRSPCDREKDQSTQRTCQLRRPQVFRLPSLLQGESLCPYY